MNEPRTRRSAPKILVADAAKNAVHVASDLLTSVGYKTQTAVDGLTALAIAKVTEPEVALLDFLLPHADGIEIARELRAAGCRTKVILMSDCPPDQLAELERLAKHAGIAQVLPVPFRIHQLINAVARALPAKKPLR